MGISTYTMTLTRKNILGKIAIVVNDKKNFCCVKDSLTVPKRIVHFTLNTRVRDI